MYIYIFTSFTIFCLFGVNISFAIFCYIKYGKKKDTHKHPLSLSFFPKIVNDLIAFTKKKKKH